MLGGVLSGRHGIRSGLHRMRCGNVLLRGRIRNMHELRRQHLLVHAGDILHCMSRGKHICCGGLDMYLLGGVLAIGVWVIVGM